MALTVRDCARHIEHTLGGKPALPCVEMVNDAGELLVNAHRWQWLEGASTTVSLVAGQSYVDLPVNMREVLQAYPTSSLTNSLQWTTPQEILRLRSTVVGSYRGYWGTITHHKAAAGGAPTVRLELWPTPSASTADYFTLFFRSGWARVDDDNDALDLPDWLEPVFKQLLRLTARGYEEDDLGAVAERFEQFKASQLWSDALTRDGMLQPSIGTQHNGLASPEAQFVGRVYYVDSIAGPS